ncbi:legumain-like isoform X1 [Acropora muricata]|uniref:legumain-like isoform X1 n=1 Tax=Acropora muricata TaxID=159855 RepID=UPI0034E48E8E
MMWTHFLIVFLSLLVSRGEGKSINAEVTHWGLIVAGSNSWYNYRHQADACHAYQILHKNGIPDKNIVVMMYDDIAHNKQNPTQGIIINKPNGTDVYHGVPKDYTKTDVTPKNFLNILKGNKAAMQEIGSGKVIESGPNDHVFVYFTDHGAPGLVAFPSGTLMASDLNDAIKYMYVHKKYQKMVFYIEACESGSMFNKLLKSNINVYATTAATPDQPSYACYYSSKYQTYLGDVYSVKWMENSDKVDVSKESLLKQFTVVKKETTTSQVMKYGDMAFVNDDIGEYQGDGDGNSTGILPEDYYSEPITDAVPAPDVRLKILENQLRESGSAVEKMKIEFQIFQLLQLKENINKTMEKIVTESITSEAQKMRVLGSHAYPVDFDCYKKAVEAFSENCYNLGQVEFALRHVYALSNLCEEKISADLIISAIKKHCLGYEPTEIDF